MPFRRIPVKILVALDSIIYAPLYAFVQKNSVDFKAKFRFFIEPVHEPINSDTSREQKLDSLAPIQRDPVFSPVIDVDFHPAHKDTWFGVGDPLRVRRLECYQGRGRPISYDFVGTLVSKLAFWLVGEQQSTFKRRDASKYNMIICHLKGMTGYYLSELFFKKCGNNPLAPVREPGSEVTHLINLLRVDWNRRVLGSDPVWLAALTTEIDKITYIRNHGPEVFRAKLINRNFIYPDEVNEEENGEQSDDTEGLTDDPVDFLMTAIVARRSEDIRQQQLIEEVTNILKDGIINAIYDLKQSHTRDQFIKHLTAFYKSRRTFSVPGSGNLFFLKRDLTETVIKLRGIYPDNLLASSEARNVTDLLLRAAIESDLPAGTPQNAIDGYVNNYKTNTWSGSNLWEA